MARSSTGSSPFHPHGRELSGLPSGFSDPIFENEIRMGDLVMDDPDLEIMDALSRIERRLITIEGALTRTPSTLWGRIKWVVFGR